MPKRIGLVTRLRSECIAEYRALHAEPWPHILALLSRANIANYTIWFYETERLLFSSFDYVGDDYDADMASLTNDPVSRRWHAITDACQISPAGQSTNWVAMEEVFRLDKI